MLPVPTLEILLLAILAMLLHSPPHPAPCEDRTRASNHVPKYHHIEHSCAQFPVFPAHGNMVAFEPLREVVGDSCNLRLDKASLSKRFSGVDFALIDAAEDVHVKRFPITAAQERLPAKKRLAAIVGAECV